MPPHPASSTFPRPQRRRVLPRPPGTPVSYSATAAGGRLLYEQHRELLEQLAAFLGERGRLPDAAELTEGESVLAAFGSVRRAFRVLCTETGRATGQLKQPVPEATFSSTSPFRRRRAAADGGAPADVQRDIKEFFGSYRAATAEADRLLFSLRSDDELSRATKDYHRKGVAGRVVLPCLCNTAATAASAGIRGCAKSSPAP